MSISFLEAKKIIGEDINPYAYNEKTNWIAYFIYEDKYGSEVNIPILINVLNEWKKNPPKKEILEDLNKCINRLDDDSISHKDIDMTFLSTIGNMVSDENWPGYSWRTRSNHNTTDDKMLELLELLIYFGLEFNVSEIKKFRINIAKKINGLGNFLDLIKKPVKDNKRIKIEKE